MPFRTAPARAVATLVAILVAAPASPAPAAHDGRATPPAATPATRAAGPERCLTPAAVAPGDVSQGAAGDVAAARWRQARAALEAARLTARERRVRVAVRDTRAEFAVGARRARHVEASERADVVETPYRTLAPARLARDGFVQRDGDAYAFYVPDAALLLSDAFAGAYCLRVAAGPPPEPGLVGVAFEPPTPRAPAVRGVLWMDGDGGPLRSLTFEYVALPQPVADAVRALPHGTLGGRIEFAALPGGAWIARRWSVRAPLLEPRAAPSFASPLGLPRAAGGGLAAVVAPARAGAATLAVAALREDAGEVLRAADPAGRTLWSADWGAAEGTVRDGASGLPLPGATVVVVRHPAAVDVGRAADGTDGATAADAAGRWALAALPSGFHTLVARDPRDSARFALAVVDVPAGETARVDLLVAALGPLAAGAAAAGGGDAASCAVLRAAAGRAVDSLLAIPTAGWRVEDAGGAPGRDAQEAVRQAHAVIQVAVDTAGRLEMGTFRVLRAESAALGDAARLVAAEMRVPPAEPAPGCPVRQLLTVPMRLRADR